MRRRAGLKKVPIIVAALLMSSGIALEASAQERLDGVLEGMAWGQSKDAVLDVIEEQLMEDFRAEADGVTDATRRDKLRKQYTERLEKIEDTYKDLVSSERSGLEISIVGDEFVTDNNESVLIVRDEIASKYLFFVEGQLYKVAVAYDPDYLGGLAFDSFVYAVSEKYGDPDDEGYDADEFLIEATWEDEYGNRLRAKDQSGIYDTHLMVFTSVELEATVEKVHEAVLASKSSDPTVSSAIDDLTSDEDDWLAEGGSAADVILGEETDVDLTKGLSEEDLKVINDEEITEEDKDDEEEKKKKKKKKDKKKKDKDKKDKDKDKDDGGGLVIY